MNPQHSSLECDVDTMNPRMRWDTMNPQLGAICSRRGRPNGFLCGRRSRNKAGPPGRAATHSCREQTVETRRSSRAPQDGPKRPVGRPRMQRLAPSQRDRLRAGRTCMHCSERAVAGSTSRRFVRARRRANAGRGRPGAPGPRRCDPIAERRPARHAWARSGLGPPSVLRSARRSSDSDRSRAPVGGRAAADRRRRAQQRIMA